MVKLRVAWLAVLIVLVSAVADARAQAVPSYAGPVTDGASVFSLDARKRLTDQLTRFVEEHKVPVSILTVMTTQPSSMAEFIGQTLVAWRDKGPARDGVIVIVALRDGRLQLHVGPLAKDKFSQQEANRVINQVIMPLMAENRFADGLEAGTNEIMKVLTGGSSEVPAAETAPADDEGSTGEPDGSYLLLGAAVALFVGALLRSAAGLLGGAIAGSALMGFSASKIAEVPMSIASLSAAIVFLVLAALDVVAARVRYTERVFSQNADRRVLDDELGGASGFW